MKIAVSTGIAKAAGGLFYAVSALCRALEIEGEEISVFGAGNSFNEEDRASWGSVSINSYTAFGPLRSSLKFRRMLRAENADLVHQHGIWLDDQWAVLQWQRRSDRPVVVSPHGMLDPWALKNAAWKKRIVETLFARASLEQATCIHALCRSEAKSIRAYGLKNPIAIIPNGITLPEISLPNSKPKTSNQKKLLFLGRIHPKKGLKELVEAWGMEQGAWRKDWKLLIAGWDDGGYVQGLKDQVGAMGALDSVEFVGAKFGAEKDDLLRNVDAFVLPSFSEGLPMSVLEAWSYGLPVVMTEFCNLPEGFDAGAALRIDPEPTAIARGLAQLTTMPGNELVAMGMNGRALVEERFAWDRIAAQMKSVYEWCLGGSEPTCIMES